VFLSFAAINMLGCLSGGSCPLLLVMNKLYVVVRFNAMQHRLKTWFLRGLFAGGQAKVGAAIMARE
jgi:hypothetical protein